MKISRCKKRKRSTALPARVRVLHVHKIMKEFLKYIENQDKEGLKSDLKELYSSYEFVRNYYRIKFNNSNWNEALISQYKEDITKAIFPNKHMQGGLDFERVESIVEQLNSKSTTKYYIEAALHGIEECTNMANEYGGDFGDDFYIYFGMFKFRAKVVDTFFEPRSALRTLNLN